MDNSEFLHVNVTVLHCSKDIHHYSAHCHIKLGVAAKGLWAEVGGNTNGDEGNAVYDKV